MSNEEPLTVNTNENNTYNLGPRFSSVQPLGYGSTGLVLSAIDSHTSKRVAIKRIPILNNQASKQALREVKFLKQLLHENIVPVYEILGSKCEAIDWDNIGTINPQQLQCVYLVEECLDTDLNFIIKGKYLDDSYTKWFIYQLLRGLKYIHSANLVHRDLKPNNILINCQDLLLKISDFGLCRVVDPRYDHKGYLTENVGTCWYRSPEQILTPSQYNEAVDMWSAGCVFAEMLLGQPLLTGSNELDQLMLIIDTIHLEDRDWGRVLRVMPNKLLKNHPFRPRTPLGEKFTDIDPKALDLLEHLLTFDPSERWSACEALAHPYLAEYSCEEEEPNADAPFHIEDEVDQIALQASNPSSQEDMPQTVASDHGNNGSNRHSPISDSQVSDILNTSSALYQQHRRSPTASQMYTRSVTTQSSPVVSISPPASFKSTSPPPTIVLDETHTLDEILNFSSHDTASNIGSIYDDIAGGGQHSSSGSNSVEDLNMRNLAQSQENLAKVPSSQNILDINPNSIYYETADNDVDALPPSNQQHSQDIHDRNTVIKSGTDSRKEKKSKNVPQDKGNNNYDDEKGSDFDEGDDDEKDIAEISQQKMAEDEELESEITENSELSENSDESDYECEDGDDNSVSQRGGNLGYFGELRVNIEDRENYKEYSQVYIKERGGLGGNTSRVPMPSVTDNRSDASSRDTVTTPTQSAKPKNTFSHLNNNIHNSDSTTNSRIGGRPEEETSLKEKKLLEFYDTRSISKFESEKLENEKNGRNKKKSNQGHHNPDPDEMYRLPTEHLCEDRDYSNERIKQKQLAKMQRHQRQCLARYRDEINELNERLKEASLDGAVGGADEFPDEPGNSPTGVSAVPTARHPPQHSDLFITTNISISEPIPEHPINRNSVAVGASIVNMNRRLEMDIVNQQRVIIGSTRSVASGGITVGRGDRRVQSPDGFSSPEELPSSPRASFSNSAGARPKRSPRKQKAL